MKPEHESEIVRLLDLYGVDMSVPGSDLHTLLTEHIVMLLMKNIEGLLNLLYRVDVNEQKVKLAFAQNDPRRIAPILTGLILERLAEKAETRVKYRNRT